MVVRLHKRHVLGRTVRIVGLTLIMIGAIAATSSASANRVLDKIKRTGVLIIGTSAAYAPFEFVANGKIVGYDVDLGDEIARRMRVKSEWHNIDFKGIIAALKSRRVDILITAMTLTSEREKQIAFSTPYYDAGIGVAFPLSHPIAKPGDLVGKVVGVQLGTSGETFVRAMNGVKEIKTYDSILLALKDLENGRVQAVVNPLPAIKYNLRGVAGIGISGVWKSSVVGINTRKEDTDLLAEINRQLTALRNDGFLEKLNKKWF